MHIKNLPLASLVSLSLLACGGTTVSSSSSGSASGDDPATGTGQTSSVVSLCDGTSATRFRYVSGGGQYAPGQTVMVENGSSILVVDGTCQFWTYDSNAGQARSGQLTSTQANALSSKLDVAEWSHWEKQMTGGGCSDGGGAVFAFGDSKLETECGAPSVPQGYIDFVTAVDDLYSALQSTPEVTGPVWITLVSVGTMSNGRPEGTWPLTTAPSTYAIDPNKGEPPAPAGMKITDPSDIAKLRAFRSSFMADDFGKTEAGDNLIAIGSDGTRYVLWMRDVMPGEDASGLTHLF